MSIGKINSAKDLFELIKNLEGEGLTPQEIEAKLRELQEADLTRYFGRYESSSGRLFFELYQHSDSVTEGSVVFRKGEKGKATLDEDLIITRREALNRFKQLIAKSYWRVFAAVTKAEMDEGNAAQIRGNEDILGLFHNEKAFIRVDCYGENYSVQRGYAGVMSSADHELTEKEARKRVTEALDNGYHREGEKPKAKPVASKWDLEDLNLD